MAIHRELTASGELVGAEGLAWPEAAKIVTHDGVGAPVVTDSPVAESRNCSPGHWLVDVGRRSDAIEIAARNVGGAEPRRQAIGQGGPGPAGVDGPRDARAFCAGRRRGSRCGMPVSMLATPSRKRLWPPRTAAAPSIVSMGSTAVSSAEGDVQHVGEDLASHAVGCLFEQGESLARALLNGGD